MSSEGAPPEIAPEPGAGADLPLLEVSGLDVEFATQAGRVLAARGVSFDIWPGEIVALVGESGSGKTTVARSIVGLLPRAGRVRAGRIRFRGRNLLELPPGGMRAVRGTQIGYIFQDPRAALDPLLAVGYQVAEAIRPGLPDTVGVPERLQAVGLLDAERRQHDFPHQFSGGMCQRVMTAIAIANQPALVIADEPTSALDVTTQAQILRLLRAQTRRLAMAMLLITHDLGIVRDLCDRVVVMYAGMVVEVAQARDLFASPQHPYTKALMESSPRLRFRQGALQPIKGSPPNLENPPGGCPFHPRCPHAFEKCRQATPPLNLSPRGGSGRAACWLAGDGLGLDRVDNGGQPVVAPVTAKTSDPGATSFVEFIDVHKRFPSPGRSRLSSWRGSGLEVRAVDGVSFTLHRGETMGLVGESGSGKSTVGRLMARAYKPSAGRITLEGEEISGLSERRMRRLRGRIQMILQDPYSSLNPRMTVEEIVAEPLRVHGLLPHPQVRKRVVESLAAVGIGPGSLSRFPHEFSGGQRQRISIARSLVSRPALVIADEPVSALDVSTQAQIVNLLKELQAEFGLTYLFIAHDLALVRLLASTVAVMYLGKLVETGPAERVFEQPLHPYTAALLSTTGAGDSASGDPEEVVLKGEMQSSVTPPSGCRFHTRCPIARTVCATVEPELKAGRTGNSAACHFPGEVRVGTAPAGPPARTEA